MYNNKNNNYDSKTETTHRGSFTATKPQTWMQVAVKLSSIFNLFGNHVIYLTFFVQLCG